MLKGLNLLFYPGKHQPFFKFALNSTLLWDSESCGCNISSMAYYIIIISVIHDL